MALFSLPGTARAVEVLQGGKVRLLLGGEASGSFSKPDEDGFNDQEYGFNSLRLVRLRLLGELQLGGNVAALTELRHTNRDRPRMYALYLRVRPWRERAFDLQAGQIPPVFGAYPRRGYAAENVFIGEPLAYHYLTPLQTQTYVGDQGAYTPTTYGSGYGVPVVSSQRWDTGVSAHLVAGDFAAAASVTQGSLCNPRVRDDNRGKGLAARVAWQPAPGWVLGASAGHGRYVSQELEAQLGRGARSQRVLGADLEYSRGRWLVRAEGLLSSWGSSVEWGEDQTLTASAGWVEARVKLLPGLSLAGRFDRLQFGLARMPPPPYLPQEYPYGQTTPWHAGVTRFELGALFALHRQVLVKSAIQYDRRATTPTTRSSFLAGQVVLWF
jgi:hypothetical protein